MPIFLFWLAPLFFLIAFLYSTVGFAGGSSYLAFLATSGLPIGEVAVISLFCNMIVSSGGTYHFSKAGQMRWRLILPFLATSIPTAYWGGLIQTHETLHKAILGICLLFVAWRIWLGNPAERFETKKPEGILFLFVSFLIGSALGFLSGFLGIGGGIFLSPILILTGWASVKEASAASSVFILLNSISGLAARHNSFYEQLPLCLILGIVVFVGGQIGSRVGAYHLPNTQLRKLLAGFISWASLRLLWVVL